MVNGNYVVQDVNKDTRNEEARKRNSARGVDRKNTNKRRGFRSATELNLTLPPKSALETEDNNNTTVTMNGEPNLLRYAIVTDESDDAFYCKLDRHNGEMEDSPRRHSFAKKPKNPSDGSNNYGRTNGSNNGSPNGNLLPTISENTVADSFEMMSEYSSFRVRSYTDPDRFRRIPDSNVSELFPDYSSAPKFDTSKYFSKPSDGHKFAAKGTHPDSLYRVTLGSGEEVRGVAARCWRALRWPAALLAVCVALALFIYYVMPDSAETELMDGNSTYWEAGRAGRFRHYPSQSAISPTADAGEDFVQQHSVYGRPPDGAPNNSTDDPQGGTEYKTTEIDFENVSSEVINKDKIKDAPKMHPVPMYPEHIAPDVQYGNEKSYSGSVRTPKLIHADRSVVQEEESTLKTPYHQTKGDYALYIKDDDIDKNTQYNARTSTTRRKSHTSDARSIPTGFQQKGKENCTSGHSKLFGISIEDAERFEATTPNSLYNTRVSPTLPALPRSADEFSISTTTRRSETDDGLSCRSTSLDICRQVLPYDLAAAPILPIALSEEKLTDLVADFERLADVACNPRVLDFVCHLLEPECTASATGVKKPCRSFCEVSVAGCEHHIYPNSTLKSMLFCAMYPDLNCIEPKTPCYEREVLCKHDTCISSERMCDGVTDCPNGVDERGCSKCDKNEYSCPGGACIPSLWLCDGYADCAEGEDEQNCRAGPDGFKPQPNTEPPPQKWLQNFARIISAADNRDGAESMLFPVKVPKNSLPRPTKVDRTRVMETAKMHESITLKGDVDSRELLVMSDTGSAARPYYRSSASRPASSTPTPTEEAAAVGTLLEDLEKMVDAEKWWEQTTEESASRSMAGAGRAGPAVTAHASPCPSGELRCVDGRCIMFSQLCDGRVDCSDSADEDNCNA